MQEAFLLQMNDFDRFLETQLKGMLDPVVATRPPVRAERTAATETVLAVDAPELIPAAEAVPVTISVNPLPQH